MTINTTLRKTFAFLLVAVAMFSASCKKDKENGPDGNGGGSGTQLTKIETDANNNSVFEYDGSGKLIKVLSKEDGESIAYTIAYNGNKISKVNVPGSEMIFNYNGNNVSKIDINVAEGSEGPNAQFEFTYENNRVKQTLMSYLMPAEEEGEDPVLVPISRISYEYYANGNVKKRTVESYDFINEMEWKTATVSTYEYDDKKNPLTIMNTAFLAVFQVQSLNNVTKEVVDDSDNSEDKTVNYTYKYNKDGYPTEMTQVEIPAGGTAGTPEVTKFSYK